jgi:hypothetical protein
MSNRGEEELYRQKYLKYKAKYLEAKNEVKGGFGFCANIGCGKCKYYIYFCKEDVTAEQAKQIFLEAGRFDGCGFDNYLATNYDGKFGYVEKRSITGEQAPFYKIKLCGKTITGKTVASYDKGPSFKTFQILTKPDFKIKATPEGQSLLTYAKKEGFKHYFVKSYKCLTSGNDGIPNQQLFLVEEPAPADAPAAE